MTKNSIHKKLAALGGLLFVTQSILAPATALASALPTTVQPDYATAVSSVTPIAFSHATDSDETAIQVISDNGSSVSLKAVLESINPTITIKAVLAKIDTSGDKVADEANPTLDEIKAYVFNEAKKAGLSTSEVATIINCESKWNDKAKGINRNGSYDLGLWQINSIHKTLSDAEKLDYKAATKWAIAKRLNEGNWSAWSCSRKLALK